MTSIHPSLNRCRTGCSGRCLYRPHIHSTPSIVCVLRTSRSDRFGERDRTLGHEGDDGMRTRAEGKILKDTYLAYKDGKLIEPGDRSALDALADAHLVEYFYTRDSIVARAVRF